MLTLGVKLFAAHSVSGVFKGKPMWSYPNLWPGLHASHTAPVADHPGELIGPTRLLGGFITPKESDAGPLWIVNGNMGAMYLFTADGLFVRTLFQDFRTGRPWSMPRSEGGMVLNDVTSGGENFWPSMTQTEDGRVFLADGARGSLVRVEHLEKLRRLPPQSMTITEKDLTACAVWQAEREQVRQTRQGSSTLKVLIRPTAPTVDGKLADWAGADWATIDRRGVTEKLDGTSFTEFLPDGVFGVCSRNLWMDETDESNIHARIARQLRLDEKLRAVRDRRGLDVAIQAELIGPGIQGNKYALKETTLRVFSVLDVGTYKLLDHATLLEVIRELGVEPVPQLDTLVLDHSVDALVALSEGTSVLIVIIDGYAWLANGEPGLGAHLHREYGGVVVGVAKTKFASATDAVAISRGDESGTAIFISDWNDCRRSRHEGD